MVIALNDVTYSYQNALMKKILSTIILSSIILISCSKDEKNIVGEWDIIYTKSTGPPPDLNIVETYPEDGVADWVVQEHKAIINSTSGQSFEYIWDIKKDTLYLNGYSYSEYEVFYINKDEMELHLINPYNYLAVKRFKKL